MDPFAQQIVSFKSCEIPDDTTNATASRSNYYQETGYRYAGYFSLVPLEMQNAINAGMFGLSQDLILSPRCSTGNCTFDPFYTIGYCSSCTDISNAVSEAASSPASAKLNDLLLKSHKNCLPLHPQIAFENRTFTPTSTSTHTIVQTQR